MTDDDKIVSINQPKGDLRTIAEVGGGFDETRVWLIVNSESLDKERVTDLLAVSPTKAWNSGEPHHPGQNESRLVTKPFGRWMLYTDLDSIPVDEKVRYLLGQCTLELENWRVLSSEYDVHMSIGGHLNNWNRELQLPLDLLRMITERHLSLFVDVYFDGDDLESE